MTNLWGRSTEPCVISLPSNLPYSLTTLPVRLVDLVNGYWYRVINFQMNGTNLKRNYKVYGLVVSWLWHSWYLIAILEHFLPKPPPCYLNRFSLTHIFYLREFLNFADYAPVVYSGQNKKPRKKHKVTSVIAIEQQQVKLENAMKIDWRYVTSLDPSVFFFISVVCWKHVGT